MTEKKIYHLKEEISASLVPCPEIFSRYLEDPCELIDDQLRVAVDFFFH